MRSRAQAVTTLPPSPDDDRRRRTIAYTVTMAVRMICIAAAFFTPGRWLLVPAAGAVVLPYFAVLLANAATTTGSGAVARPGAIELARG